MGSREEIFITSKLWLQDYGYEGRRKKESPYLLKNWEWIISTYTCSISHTAMWQARGKALEEAKEEGKLKSIGVSNMTPKIWKEFVPQFATLPAVNQVECNPFSSSGS